MQDLHGHSSGTQQLSVNYLQDINGYCFIKSASGFKKVTSAPEIRLFNSKKLGHLTQIIIIALARSGNVATNPGPSNQNVLVNNKRKYVVKFPCSVCSKGVRSRALQCKSCKLIAHVRCITTNTTNDLLNFSDTMVKLVHHLMGIN